MQLKPNDLDKIYTIENCQRINIDELVKEVNGFLKDALLKSKIAVFSKEIELTTTQTRFNGKKIWFQCPKCGKRTSVLLKNPINHEVQCRKCSNLLYFKQTFKVINLNSR